MTLIKQDPALVSVKRRVAKILLKHAKDSNNGNNRLAQRDMAEMLGTGWSTIHLALKSLLHDGAIKIERNRIILNQELIQKMAEAA